MGREEREGREGGKEEREGEREREGRRDERRNVTSYNPTVKKRQNNYTNIITTIKSSQYTHLQTDAVITSKALLKPHVELLTALHTLTVYPIAINPPRPLPPTDAGEQDKEFSHPLLVGRES